MSETATKERKPYIERIVVKKMYDECPDTSWIGEFTNIEPTVEELESGKVIERESVGRLECRYFVPANPEYGYDELEQMESFNRGDWFFFGISAEARVMIPSIHPDSWKLETIDSGGLWGLESTMFTTELEECANEQVEELKQYIQELTKIDISNWDEIPVEVSEDIEY